MKKITLILALLSTIVYVACNSASVPNQNEEGYGRDTTEEPMDPNDSSGLANPVDTVLDTSITTP